MPKRKQTELLTIIDSINWTFNECKLDLAKLQKASKMPMKQTFTVDGRLLQRDALTVLIEEIEYLKERVHSLPNINTAPKPALTRTARMTY